MALTRYEARQEWRRQPPADRARLRDGGIASGLIVSVEGNNPRAWDAVRNEALTASTTEPAWQGRHGITGFNTTGTAESSYKLLRDGPLAAADPWTFACTFSNGTFQSLAQFFGFGYLIPANSIDSSGTVNGTYRGLLSFNSNYYFWGAAADWDTGIAFDTDNQLHTAMFVHDGTNIYFYRDGVQRASTARPGGLIATPSGRRFVIGARHTGGSASPSAVIGPCRAWNRALSAGEAEWYGRNPWIVYEPESVPIWFDLGAGGATLVIADATHGHLADNVTLTQAHQLALADATHGHLADGISLTQQHQLAVADATHAHAADNVTLAVQHVLAILDATHAHAADNVTLEVAGTLAIADATHGHSADGVTLTQAHLLAIADALHAHGADNLVLDANSGITLTIQDALHAHGADNVALTQVHALVVSDALHAHLAQSLTLALPGAAIDHNRLLLIRAEDRILVIAAESRLWNIPAEDRIWIVH